MHDADYWHCFLLQSSGTGPSICLQLYCDNGSGGCTGLGAAAADGTMCGTDMWCSQGECVPQIVEHSIEDQNCDGNSMSIIFGWCRVLC